MLVQKNILNKKKEDEQRANYQNKIQRRYLQRLGNIPVAIMHLIQQNLKDLTVDNTISDLDIKLADLKDIED